jgi:hypothetical protein
MNPINNQEPAPEAHWGPGTALVRGEGGTK